MKHRMLRLFVTLFITLSLSLTLLMMVGGGISLQAKIATRYVALGGNCNGAAPCYDSIQTAVDNALEGDEIRVAAGTYTGVSVREELTQVVYISKTVVIRGGYNADFSAWDPKMYTTTLDAQGQGRVIYITGHSSPTVEALYITGGRADEYERGGGVYVNSNSVNLNNNIIANSTANFGGGVYLEYREAIHSATLDGNTIFNNIADDMGGGISIYAPNSSIVIMVSNNDIFSNTAFYGGGIDVGYDSNLTLENNNICGNTARWDGGGVRLYLGGAILNGNTICENTAELDGGGISLAYDHNYKTILNANTIFSNTANRGGGVSAYHISNARLLNNVIAANQAITGSGVYVGASYVRLFHNTVARNVSDDSSGIYVTSGSAWRPGNSSVVLTNTILVDYSVGISVTGGNTVTINGILWDSNLPITVSQSITAVVVIQNQYVGNPVFAVDSYHITPASDVLDRGVPTQIITDIDGEIRPQGVAPDLGADEISAAALPKSENSQVTFASPDGVVTELDISGAAITESLSLVYTPTVPTTSPSDFSFAGRAFDLVAYRGGAPLETFSFNPAATITLYYTDVDVAGLDEEQLYLYTWNTSAGIWEDAACGDYARHPTENWLSVPICHLSQFALFGKQGVQPAPTIIKRVSPEGQVQYGGELTYTLAISSGPGTEVGVYDPLTDTTFIRFVEQPTGVEYANHAITGTMTITPTNQMTVSFVVEVGVPGTVGVYVDVSNTACIYPAVQTISMCEWSNTVTNQAYRPYTIFLPLVMCNQ